MKTVKEGIDSKPLSYPVEKVSISAASHCDIYYGSYDKGTDNVKIAVFQLSAVYMSFPTQNSVWKN